MSARPALVITLLNFLKNVFLFFYKCEKISNKQAFNFGLGKKIVNQLLSSSTFTFERYIQIRL